MQVAIWILSVLGVIGVGIGLGYLIYYLFWRVYGGRREISVTRSEFEEFKSAIEAQLEEGLINPSELDMLKKAIKAEEARKGEESVARSEFEEFKTAIETKLEKGLVNPSELDMLKKAIKAEGARKGEESVARSEFEEFRTAIETKLGEEYVTIGQFASFRESIRKAM